MTQSGERKKMWRQKIRTWNKTAGWKERKWTHQWRRGKYVTLQSNQRCIKELQINVKTCSFELCQFGLKMTHKTHPSSLWDAPPTRLPTHTTVWIHLHVIWVLVSAASVGDDVEVALVRLCHNEVVHDTSFLIGEEGQRTLEGGRMEGEERNIKN